MNIHRLFVRLNQRLISGHMSQHPQFNLGVIGVNEHITILGNKNFPYKPSKFHTYRNILQIWFRAADSSRSRNRLIEPCREYDDPMI